jgi:hypothetical protein
MQQEEEEEQKIIDKNGFKIIKSGVNKFNLTFDIINNNILLPKIINFDLIELLNKLNPNIFESMHLDCRSDTNAIMDLLIKDLFSDLGIPHYYLALKINIESENDELNTNKIIFKCLTFDNKLHSYPVDAELIPIHSINMTFDIINNHNLQINCDIYLSKQHNIPSFFEKIIGNIFYNLFNKLKQFIEKVSF